MHIEIKPQVFYTDSVVPCSCGFSKTSMAVVVAYGFILFKDSVIQRKPFNSTFKLDCPCFVFLILVVKCVLAI